MTGAPPGAWRENAAPDEDDKNRIYDTVTGPLWRTTVYEPVHGGWEFTNIAGARLLDDVAATFRVGPLTHVLELCSGTGAVARYLNQRTGCAVTGVERNAAQLTCARRARAEAGPGMARVSFVEGDVTRWQPDRLYDLALVVDSLSLLSDPVAALRNARRALCSAGWLVFADTLAGPEMTAATQRRAWDLDGLRPLPGGSRSEDLFTAAGLVDVHLVDVTDTAVTCFQTIADATAERAGELAAVVTAEELTDWRTATDFYLDAYRSGQLTYWHGLARRPRRATARQAA
ncbi:MULTISPECIES: class I SAM-dependent methyltransferase [unclassified Micromonospora]|uniref:class I SAM-dependent methyltransferase n=1 Tax=unclassified Micromonospora TaxID=2617518 RepID=UPI001C245E11|nr:MULTISPECIES: class I SAM-dependent methyltransferase [unclassified Micromonospora]MBU8860294.1 class I SAM-dependent methyltransferase [Micromonospora sp. WMMB482]MDM4779828.1 class I SAM-dependent methyltransferase [Micromonospora sp. b486]